jgi:hypothetical protein
MRRPLQMLGIALGLLFTLLWPMLLGALIAGREGILFSGLVYVAFGCLFLGLVLIGGIRGILSS